MTGPSYVGSELEVFAHATTWKNYFGAILRPFLTGIVVEVGAGLGATTRVLCDGSQRLWLCLEPDGTLSSRIEAAIRSRELPACCRVVVGTTGSLAPRGGVDAVLYIDVLEHIRDDAAELETVLPALRPGGHLLVVAPAHPELYTPFDAAVGHFRRYRRHSLRAAAPARLEEVDIRYLDCAGLLASVGNRLLLRQAEPSHAQIRFWDRRLVPISRRLDPIFRYNLGKSVLGIWRRSRE